MIMKKLFQLIYVLFVLFSLYMSFFKKDFGMAASYMMIALVFDPFDDSLQWQLRPLWQRIWLLAHLALAVVFFVMWCVY